MTFVFPQLNFSFHSERSSFGSNKPIVKNLQELLAFLHEAAAFTFLREISGKTAYGREMLRISVSATLHYDRLSGRRRGL
jgi:hypothetical protein